MFFVVCAAVDWAILRWLDLEDPWKWFRLFNGVVVVLGTISLLCRIFTGYWEPLIPEYAVTP